MHEMSKKFKITLAVILIITILILIVAMYKDSKNKLLDKSAFKDYTSDIELASEDFTSNEDMMDYIVDWADDNDIECTVDDGENIIFEKSAASNKKSADPIVVAINYNYRTALSNAKAIATGLSIAASDLDTGKYTIIFFNNDGGNNEGYQKVDEKYFSDDAKVVYLDLGKSAYMSTSSFASSDNTIEIPCELEPITCDTAIKLNISGIITNDIGVSIGNQPNPITALGTVLSRLNNKSITYQLADVEVTSPGNMYPTGIEATILINSYSIPNFTKYLDERSEKYLKSYKEDFPDVDYSYEIIDDSADFPEVAYSKDASTALNTVLYTVKNGSYKATEDYLPEGLEVDDTYAVNVIKNFTYENGNIVLTISTMGLNDQILGNIIKENATAATFAEAKSSKGLLNHAFNNETSKLADEIGFAYVKVNTINSKDMIIKQDYDKIFTPCTYLNDINDKMDIVHVREDDDSAMLYANTLLCFIKDQSNFLSL